MLKAGMKKECKDMMVLDMLNTESNEGIGKTIKEGLDAR
jgi:hypothetical protein